MKLRISMFGKGGLLEDYTATNANEDACQIEAKAALIRMVEELALLADGDRFLIEELSE